MIENNAHTKDAKTEFLLGIQTETGMPEDIFQLLVSLGEDIVISPNSILQRYDGLRSHFLFIDKGVVRDYYLDGNGVDHTLRFLQGPAYLSTNWDADYTEIGKTVTSESMTTVNGTAWSFTNIHRIRKMFPRFNQIIIKWIVLEVKEMNVKESRLHHCTALERYKLFIEEFPDVVNQVPLKYIASHLNMTSETFSRVRAAISQEKGEK